MKCKEVIDFQCQKKALTDFFSQKNSISIGNSFKLESPACRTAGDPGSNPGHPKQPFLFRKKKVHVAQRKTTQAYGLGKAIKCERSEHAWVNEVNPCSGPPTVAARGGSIAWSSIPALGQAGLFQGLFK
ncbi:MAG: hypothetical protein V1494_04075 [Candidatus Diapherotrites archaeon]